MFHGHNELYCTMHHGPVCRNMVGKKCQATLHPYEFFTSVNEIYQCTVYPAIENFQTEMKPVDYEFWMKGKTLFEEKMNSGEWSSFGDYLKYYNEMDTLPLA